MSSEQAQLLRNHTARQIYDTISEKGPITAKQLGEELPDIPRSKRGSMMQRLHNVGLIRRTTDSHCQSIWEVAR